MAYPTNPIYKLIKNPITGVVDQVKKEQTIGGRLFKDIIPFNTDNMDYKIYLDWVAEGNTAEAAD
jgi:hypothetical protein|tara:strand:- start:34 stop:228 length:195 start_codon:yes stop_codon:yes gene_type:complete